MRAAVLRPRDGSAHTSGLACTCLRSSGGGGKWSMGARCSDAGPVTHDASTAGRHHPIYYAHLLRKGSCGQVTVRL